MCLTITIDDMPINIPTQKHILNYTQFVFRHFFPMICGQVSVIRKSARANPYAPEKESGTVGEKYPVILPKCRLTRYI
jgi:hypothetical protein